jgi:hypothetical protein
MLRTGRFCRTLLAAAAVMLAVTACSAAAGPSGHAAARPYLMRFHVVSQVAATVPANGDVNPYGVAIVRQTTGRLAAGDILVSNFNSKANVQGRGTTIVEISPDGGMRLFARLGALPPAEACPGGVGLTTGLEVLPGGWVVVGSLPSTAHGTLPAVNPTGCLIVLDSRGTPVETWVSPDINGPWDMTMRAQPGHASLFVSNVLARPGSGRSTPPQTGLCTVVRVNITLAPGARPRMTSTTVLAGRLPWQQNKAALVQGPTGLALSPAGTLYVASTVQDSISAVPDAMTRRSPVRAGSGVLTSGGSLSGPLGLTVAPDGDLIAVNGNNGKAVEVTQAGRQVAAVTLVPHGAGDLFGVTPTADGQGLLFVNDGTNALDLFSS